MDVKSVHTRLAPEAIFEEFYQFLEEQGLEGIDRVQTEWEGVKGSVTVQTLFKAMRARKLRLMDLMVQDPAACPPQETAWQLKGYDEALKTFAKMDEAFSFMRTRLENERARGGKDAGPTRRKRPEFSAGRNAPGRSAH